MLIADMIVMGEFENTCSGIMALKSLYNVTIWWMEILKRVSVLVHYFSERLVKTDNTGQHWGDELIITTTE